MRGKKIFGIGAAVLLVTLTFSSTVYSGSENKDDKEFILALSDFVENNSEDLEKIGDFLLNESSDYNFGQPLPALPQELEMIINDLQIEIESIFINFHNLPNQSNYLGRCAHYWSNGHARFFEDEGDLKNYTGFCWTLCKKVTGMVSDILTISGDITIVASALFMMFIPIFGFFYALLLVLIIIPIWLILRALFKVYRTYSFGLTIFYFRCDDVLHPFFNKNIRKRQSGNPEWNPEWDYPQKDWITLVYHNE
jgi:hypothetical protein